MTLDRRAIFTSGAAAALLAASGVSAQAVPRAGGRLRVALSGASRSDSWGAGGGLFMQAARHSVFEALTEIAADGTLRGALATHWTTRDAGRVWTFTLRDGVKFHNGAPLRAADVVASLGGSARADAKGRVVVTLEDARPDFPYALADVLIHRASGPRDVGTGLYRVSRFDAGRQFIGTRVDQHYRDGQAGWFDTIEFASIPDASVRAEALRTGLVDVADVTSQELGPDPEVTAFGPHSVHCDIGLPMHVGQRQPLDDLRMAARWWRV